MSDVIVMGPYVIRTVETRREDDAPNREGSWTSVAFIRRDGEAYPFSALRNAIEGGDAFEARRHAIARARRRIRRLEMESRAKSFVLP